MLCASSLLKLSVLLDVFLFLCCQAADPFHYLWQLRGCNYSPGVQSCNTPMLLVTPRADWQRWFLNATCSSRRQPPACWVRWTNTPKLRCSLFFKFRSSFQWNSWLCFVSSKFGEVQVMLFSSVETSSSCLICHLIVLHLSDASDHFFFFLMELVDLIPSILHRSSMHRVPKKCDPCNVCMSLKPFALSPLKC